LGIDMAKSKAQMMQQNRQQTLKKGEKAWWTKP
jgi:hypothetical protein